MIYASPEAFLAFFSFPAPPLRSMPNERKGGETEAKKRHTSPGRDSKQPTGSMADSGIFRPPVPPLAFNAQ